MDNAERLFLSGYFEEAYEISSALLSPGPWKIKLITNLAQEIERLHPLFCMAAGKDCPEVGDEVARNLSELNQWAEQRWDEFLDFQVMADRMQLHPASEKWCDIYFATVLEMSAEGGIYKDYGQFVDDLDHVMKHRLREKVSKTGPDLLPGFVKKLMPQFRTDADISISSNAEQGLGLKWLLLMGLCYSSL